MLASLPSRILPTALVLAAGACGDSDPVVATPDARVADAAASSVDARPMVDARPTPDASADASPDANLAELATVVYREEGVAKAGAKVVFYGGQGVTAELTTGSDGKASAPMVAGGSITVAVTPGTTGFRELYTVLGARPGETIPINAMYIAQFDPTGASLGTASITLPGAFAQADAYVAYIGGECHEAAFNATNPIRVPLYEGCLDANGKIRVVAVARASIPSKVLNLAYSVVTVDKSTDPSIQLPAWKTDWSEAKVTMSNVPDVSLDLSAILRARDGSLFYLDSSLDTIASPASSVEEIVRFPGQALGTSASLSLYSGGTTSGVFHEVRSPSYPPTASIDLAKDLLPRVTSVAVDSAGITPVVMWTADGPMTDADGATLTLISGSTRWTVLIPPSTISPVTLPALPDSLATYRPGATAKVDLVFLALDVINGYTDLRTKLGPRHWIYIPDDLEQYDTLRFTRSWAKTP